MLPVGRAGIDCPRCAAASAAVLTGRGEKAASRRMALVAFVIRIVSAALAFVSQIILARIMGEFEYGIFVFVWVLVVLFGNLSCLGFHTAVIRFLPQYKAVRRRCADPRPDQHGPPLRAGIGRRHWRWSACIALHLRRRHRSSPTTSCRSSSAC